MLPIRGLPCRRSSWASSVFLLALLALLTGCSVPVQSMRPFDQPPIRYSVNRQFNIAANQPWQDTGVAVERGDLLFIDAKGQWSGGLGWESGPSGAVGLDAGRILAEEPAATALIGRIGSGPAFSVRDQYVAQADRDGTVALRINDPTVFDNWGALAVTVYVQKASEFASPEEASKVALQLKLQQAQHLVAAMPPEVFHNVPQINLAGAVPAQPAQVAATAQAPAPAPAAAQPPPPAPPTSATLAPRPGAESGSGRRTALVIGNAAYPEAPLRNTLNDAQDMAESLRRLGFEVILRLNADLRTMEQALDEFYRKLQRGGTGLFYYSGHGLQVQGLNYLLPLHARLASESDVRFQTMEAGRVLGKMEDAGNELNIVILDACRNNPFVRQFRSATQGLARMDAPTGSLIAYATAPGSVASDGHGRNGTYTKHLLQHLSTPDLAVTDLFMRVRMGVVEETSKAQVPWESSSLTGYFYFNKPPR